MSKLGKNEAKKIAAAKRAELDVEMDEEERKRMLNAGMGIGGGLHKGDEKDAIRKPREWNRLRIRAIGPRIQVWLNENSIVDFTHKNPPAYLLKPGPIALQTYGAEGHSGWVKFRRMQIIEWKK